MGAQCLSDGRYRIWAQEGFEGGVSRIVEGPEEFYKAYLAIGNEVSSW